MMTRKFLPALVAGLIFSGPVAAAQERAIRDDLGNNFRIPELRPRRIVSLAPNLTEILFALGLGDRVVGVTRFCDVPEAALGIRKVGGLVDPNIELILALKPDLIVAFRGNPRRVLTRLRALGLPVFILDSPQDVGSLPPLITKIGLITGSETPADRLSESLRARISRVDRALEGIRARPRVFVMLYGQGLWTCGAESFLDDLLTRAGAINVAGRVPRKWFLYNRERLVRDNPDSVVILSRTEEDFAEARKFVLGESSYQGIEAVEAGRIYRLDENAASRFGPRLVDVLEELAGILHPERFGGRP